MQADLRRAARNDAAFTSLDWSEHSIESEHANALAKSLAGNTHLQSIRIRYGIYMTANAAKRLEAALVRTCVVSAVVVGRSYSHDGRTIIRDVQANNNATLRKHCVANAARRAEQDDASLTELDWSNAGVDDDDLAVLGEALTDNTRALISKNGFAEYFDPTNGAPAGGRDFTWTAAVWLAWASPNTGKTPWAA